MTVEIFFIVYIIICMCESQTVASTILQQLVVVNDISHNFALYENVNSIVQI